MAKKVHKLNTHHPLYFQITGIVSDEEIVILAHQLNQSLHFQLKQFSSPEITAPDSSKNSFNAYSSLPEENNLVLTLICNKNEKGFLLDQYKNFDYLFIKSSYSTSLPDHTLQKNLRDIKQIMAVASIDMLKEKYKSLIKDVLHQIYLIV